MFKWQGINKKSVTIFAAFLGLLLCAAIPLSIAHQCNQRLEIPIIPIQPYPNSEFVEEHLRESSGSRLATIYYTNSAPPDDIIDYFESRLDCRLSDDGKAAMCRGILENIDDEYFYYVREDVSGLTSIALEIRWEICNWDSEWLQET